LEKALHPWTSFVVLPLFALANAGVRLVGEPLTAFLNEPVTLGIIAGLVIGKPLGITLAAFIMVKTGLGRLPRGVGWLEIIGVGLLGGVGFTVAIFVAGLAFDDAALTGAAKVGILAASALAGIIGAGFLAARDAAKQRLPEV
jgi:NhaA family Na+:H+ antiporter